MLKVLIVLISLHLHASSLPMQGQGTYYYPHVMEKVIEYRKYTGLKVDKAVFGYVAVPNCDLIGYIVTVCLSNGRCERFQVVDCSQYRDWGTHTKGGTQGWVELDYSSAKKLHLTNSGRFHITIYGLYYNYTNYLYYIKHNK